MDDAWPRVEGVHIPTEPNLLWQHDVGYATFYVGYGYVLVASSLRTPLRTRSRSWSTLSSLSPGPTSLFCSYFLTLRSMSDLSVGEEFYCFNLFYRFFFIFHFAFLVYFMLLVLLSRSYFYFHNVVYVLSHLHVMSSIYAWFSVVY